MLCLSRKLYESIKIGEDVTVTVVRLGSGSVRLGIEAPKNVRIVRTELPCKQLLDQKSPDPEGSPEG